MTIFTDGLRQGADIGVHELPSSLGEYLGAVAGDAYAANPLPLLRGMSELSSASGATLEATPDMMGMPQLGADDAAVPDVPIAEAQGRVKALGLDKTLHLPGQATVKAPALDIMIERAQARREREATIARGPSGVIPGALSVGTSLLVSAADPINIAAAFIPIVGEARYAKLMASAGESILARAAVRAEIGTLAGGVGMAALEPLQYWARTQEGQDYTFNDALRSVITGAVLGGTLHAAGGALADLVRSRRGKPVYPFAPDEPFAPQPGPQGRADVAPAAPGGPEARADAAQPLGGPPRPTHPVVAGLDDLPPRAKEDAMRSAIAALREGEPVRTGELLVAAAERDPRIAESLDLWHGSPHDFEAFDLGKIGAGEGVQAYGHGLYFAEKADVAASYQKKLSITGTTIEDTGKFVAEQYLRNPTFKGDRARVLAALAAQAEKLPPSSKVHFEEAQQLVKDGWDPGATHLYRVRIHADKEHFLDWDKPLSEQPEILDRLKSIPESEWQKINEHLKSWGLAPFDLKSATGEDLHQLLGGRSKTEAASLLHDAGIPGIKYLDQGSRAKGEGTRNYVVFSDKDVVITHKNGEPVPPRRGGGTPGSPSGLPDPARSPGPPADGNLSRGAGDVESVWRDLAERRPDFDEPEAVAASQAAQRMPEPESLKGEPSARVAAAERAAAETEADYKANEPYIPPELRERVERDIAALDLAAKDRAEVIERGAACLAAAVGSAA